MKLLLLRDGPVVPNFGKLYRDGDFYCDTLEDEDRFLEKGGIKVKTRTAIPRGVYQIVIDFSPKFGKDMIHVLNVPQFTGIRIHGGVDEDDTEGCPLVGQRKHQRLENGLFYSKQLTTLVGQLIAQGERVTLEVA